MLGKQAWRLLQQPHSLWGKLFKALYFPSKDFLKADTGARPSWGWQSLLAGREVILPNIQWSADDETQIKIREDRWLPRGRLIGPAAREEPMFVADLLDNNSNRWNVAMLNQFYDASLVQEIQRIPINANFASDRLVWTATTQGIYTIKSGYLSIRKTSLSATSNTNCQPSSSY